MPSQPRRARGSLASQLKSLNSRGRVGDRELVDYAVQNGHVLIDVYLSEYVGSLYVRSRPILSRGHLHTPMEYPNNGRTQEVVKLRAGHIPPM